MTGRQHSRLTVRTAVEMVAAGHSKRATSQLLGVSDTQVGKWCRWAETDPDLTWIPERKTLHGATHGTTSAYQNGCRCRTCRDWMATEQHRREKARRLGQPILIPSTGSIRRIQALYRLGWTSRHIGEAAGLSKDSVKNTGEYRNITRDKAQKIDRAYRKLSMSVGPCRQTAGLAETRGYPPPLAWDDDEIDDPKALPKYGRTDRGLGKAKLPADRDQLAQEVNTAGIRNVTTKYGVTRGALSKALNRAGYVCVHDDGTGYPIYRRKAA